MPACFRNDPKFQSIKYTVYKIIEFLVYILFSDGIEYVNLLLLVANSNYEDFSVYDIADMIKLYFRQLPEPVLTTKLSEMLIIIQQSESNSIYFTISFWREVC